MDKRFGSLFGYFLALAVVTAAIMVAIPWLPDLISDEGKAIDDLFWGMIWLSVVIFSMVGALVLYSIRHFRAEPGDLSDGEPITGNHKLELVWTIIPAIIVATISVLSYIVLLDNEKDPAAGKLMKVQVRAFQFGWNYTYPGSGVKEATELVLPIDKTIRFDVMAVGGTKVAGDKQDVMHAFWVPESRLKIDAVPGLHTKTQWTPNTITRPGDRPQVVCAELCGSGHNSMRTDMCVTSAEVFDFWTGHTQLTCMQLKLMTCWGGGPANAAVQSVAVLAKDPELGSCKDAKAVAAKLTDAELSAAELVVDPPPEEGSEPDASAGAGDSGATTETNDESAA